MTDLEKKCANALRLSDASTEALLEMIQSNIEIARADMIRSGISRDIALDDDNPLVANIIIKYVVSEMASVEVERDKALEIYRLCLDELRKSYVE